MYVFQIYTTTGILKTQKPNFCKCNIDIVVHQTKDHTKTKLFVSFFFVGIAVQILKLKKRFDAFLKKIPHLRSQLLLKNA